MPRAAAEAAVHVPLMVVCHLFIASTGLNCHMMWKPFSVTHQISFAMHKDDHIMGTRLKQHILGSCKLHILYLDPGFFKHLPATATANLQRQQQPAAAQVEINCWNLGCFETVGWQVKPLLKVSTCTVSLIKNMTCQMTLAATKHCRTAAGAGGPLWSRTAQRFLRALDDLQAMPIHLPRVTLACNMLSTSTHLLTTVLRFVLLSTSTHLLTTVLRFVLLSTSTHLLTTVLRFVVGCSSCLQR
jgi:hypothetical protein